MEKKIFEELITRLTSVVAGNLILAAGLPALKTIAWWEEQVEAALGAAPDNQPFDCPAVFVHFSKDTEYAKGNGMTQKAEGEITLHLVQTKVGKQGTQGDESLAEFKSLLDYVDVLIELVSNYQLPCSAKPMMVKVKRDHTNTPLMAEEVVYEWHGVRRSAP